MLISRIAEKRMKLLTHQFHYWRDKTRNKIDLLISTLKNISIVGIKSGNTLNTDFWKTLFYFEKLTKNEINKILIDCGDQNQKRSQALEIKSWNSKLTKLLIN